MRRLVAVLSAAAVVAATALVALPSAAAAKVPAAGDWGTFSGRVVGPTGRPLEGVTVTALSQRYGEFRALTDSDGRYVISRGAERLEAEMYRVKFSKDGFLETYYNQASTSGEAMRLNSWAGFTNIDTALRMLPWITFLNPGEHSRGRVLTLRATESSGLPVSYRSLTESVCVVSPGSRVSLVGVGTCTVVASRAASPGYLDSLPVTQSFTSSAAPVEESAVSVDVDRQSAGRTI